jgi:E3 ubiquitin-protein ligase MARCH5
MILYFLDFFVQVLNKLDKTANQLCPFVAAGVVVSTIYWSAASYGAITVMQVIRNINIIT